MGLRLDIAMGLLLCEARRRHWESIALAFGDSMEPPAVFARFMWWRCERNTYAMRLLARATGVPMWVLLAVRSGNPRP